MPAYRNVSFEVSILSLFLTFAINSSFCFTRNCGSKIISKVARPQTPLVIPPLDNPLNSSSRMLASLASPPPPGLLDSLLKRRLVALVHLDSHSLSSSRAHLVHSDSPSNNLRRVHSALLGNRISSQRVALVRLVNKINSSLSQLLVLARLDSRTSKIRALAHLVRSLALSQLIRFQLKYLQLNLKEMHLSQPSHPMPRVLLRPERLPLVRTSKISRTSLRSAHLDSRTTRQTNSKEPIRY